MALNDAVKKADVKQGALDQEFEIFGIRRAGRLFLVPRAKLAKISQMEIGSCRLAETLDYQLKQIRDDLKEIIEHLNEANKFADPNDLMMQIGKNEWAHELASVKQLNNQHHLAVAGWYLKKAWHDPEEQRALFLS